ncbi:MAG: glycosyltransferase [Oscillospiraceae bacterium]|nr:glycosyltransferase [Oscillospiraceae bacterium]
MKLLIIPSWYSSPAMPVLGSVFREQAEALAARGVDVAVLYTEVNNKFRGSGITVQNVNGVATYKYFRPNLTPKWERGRAFQRRLMMHRLYRRLEREWGRPDVINLRSSLQGDEAVSLAKWENLPLFFMEHSSFVVTEGAGSAAQKRLFATMDAAAVNACVGSTLYEVMAPHKETRIIPDFVDGERFSILPQEKGENAPFLFAAMGQLRPIKGYDMLIEAFAKLRGLTDRPIRLHIAGAGDERERLQKLIDRLGIGEDCRLVGAVPREQVPAFMNACDCFICSSRREMLSCVLHECAACGKPAIGTMCGGPQDIITDETGLLVPVDDPCAMAAAMLRMLDGAPKYDPEVIRASILERFSVETVCGQLVRACEDAIAMLNAKC